MNAVAKLKVQVKAGRGQGCGECGANWLTSGAPKHDEATCNGQWRPVEGYFFLDPFKPDRDDYHGPYESAAGAKAGARGYIYEMIGQADVEFID